MSKINDDGGPAFPLQGGVEQLETSLPLQGMTLRDYFAAKIASGDAACGDGWQLGGEFTDHQKRVIDARALMYYEIADAMLRARKTKS